MILGMIMPRIQSVDYAWDLAMFDVNALLERLALNLLFTSKKL